MKKVLIVEDDQFLANAYKLKLSKSGFEVMVATDGSEALTLLKDFTPDIILLDLIMPNIDGFATLGALKKDEKLKSIPVIIASNLGQKEDIEKALALGAVDFIIKSNVSIEEIVQKVTAVIGA
ncbi:response regulator [Candidatus Woesebacteria bacterium]|nr:response regulator [Candidatus Woesebacteria bacterium]